MTNKSNIKVEVRCFKHELDYDFPQLVRHLLDPEVPVGDCNTKAYERVYQDIRRILQVVPSSIAKTMTPEDVAKRFSFRDLTVVPSYEVLDERAGYAPAVLIALVAYTLCRFRGIINPTGDDYAIYRFGTYLQTIGANKHVFDLASMADSADLLFTAMPTDETGTVYAINPMFELSGATLRKMLGNSRINWRDTLSRWASIALDRALNKKEIPPAHPDYQNDDVRKFFIGGSPRDNHHSNNHRCVKCTEKYFAYRIQIKNGEVAFCYYDFLGEAAEVAEPCPAAAQESRVSEIAVPSGKLIFNDTFRFAGFDDLTRFSSFQLGTEYGRVAANQFSAKNGIFMGSVPAANWHICGAMDNKIMILADPRPDITREPGQSDEEFDEAYDSAVWAFDVIEHVGDHPMFTYLGEIDTVCWSYSMMDEHFMTQHFPDEQDAIPSKPKLTTTSQGYGKLHCPPGTYRQIYIDTDNVFEWENLPEIQELPAEVRDTLKTATTWPVISVLVHTSLL